MTFDPSFWQERLDLLADKHDVVGASLAISRGAELVEAATGVLNLTTGQPATPDALFQVGSITKVWTATLVLQLVDEGLLDLDAPLATYLPDFRVVDDVATKTVTTRQLLCHTSGIDGDLFLDTGRGDDAVARYVEAMAALTQVVPQGQVMSYCNSGYILLGHLVATLRGATWEQVLQERLLVPLGLTSAGTLPEEALLHAAAAGHVPSPEGGSVVTPQWGIYRSCGPAGLLHGPVRDQLAFARLHLSGGLAPDGTRLLSEQSVHLMQQAQIAVPDRWLLGTHWGLGWFLSDYDGRPVFGHDGATLGQGAFLRILPDADLAVALAINGGRAARELFEDLFVEIFEALAGVTPSRTPKPPVEPVHIEISRYVGTYAREGQSSVVAVDDTGRLMLTMVNTSPLAATSPPTAPMELVGFEGDTLLCKVDGSDLYMPAVFFELDGEKYLHLGARTTRRTGGVS